MSCDLWGLVTPGSEPGNDPQTGAGCIVPKLNLASQPTRTRTGVGSTDSVGHEAWNGDSST